MIKRYYSGSPLVYIALLLVAYAIFGLPGVVGTVVILLLLA